MTGRKLNIGRLVAYLKNVAEELYGKSIDWW